MSVYLSVYLMCSHGASRARAQTETACSHQRADNRSCDELANVEERGAAAPSQWHGLGLMYAADVVREEFRQSLGRDASHDLAAYESAMRQTQEDTEQLREQAEATRAKIDEAKNAIAAHQSRVRARLHALPLARAHHQRLLLALATAVSVRGHDANPRRELDHDANSAVGEGGRGKREASGGRVKGLLQGPAQEMLRFFDHLSAANTGAGSSVHVPAAWALDAMC